MALAPIQLSGRGITGWLDPGKVATGDMLDALNVDFSYGHTVQKEGGTVKVNSSALSGAPTVLAGIDYWPDASTQRRVIATSDGKLYKDDMGGTFATTLKSGLSSNKITHLVEAGAESQGRNKKLFSTNGTDVVQVLSGDGATTSNIGANKPADWTGTNQPTFLFRFRNTLAGGGNTNDPHRVYISTAADHEDFTSAGALSLSVFPGEGQKLVAGLTALGKGYLWKFPTGIYYIFDDDTTASNWVIKKITNQYGGAASPHSVAQIDESTIAFISSAGDLILMLESAGSLTGVEFVNLTKDLNLRNYVTSSFDLGRLNMSQLRWYQDKLQLHILLAAAGSAIENRRLILDFSEERAKVHVSNKDTNTAIWMELDSSKIARPIIGDNAGFVQKIDQIPRSLAGGAAYTMILQTVPTDFSDLSADFSVKKLFYRLHMEYIATGNYNVAVEVTVDGQNRGTVFFNQGTSGSTLPFTLPATLAGADLRRRSRAIVGEGYYISLRVIDSTTNNPRIARAWVEFDPLEMAR